jgi:hypothetical protein
VIARRSIEAGRRDLGDGAKDKENFLPEKKQADKTEKAVAANKNVHGLPGRHCTSLYMTRHAASIILCSPTQPGRSTCIFDRCVRALSL